MMRIPVYRAEGGVTTQAPGRSIQARKNAQPFVNAALAQGQVVSEVANQVGQYAATRYKILTENNLNEALLGAEETMRTRAKELLESNDYRNALDGDDPIWTREMEEVKSELRDRIGGDRYALQQFDARFGQMELTQRFSLRSAIDTKIQQAAARARAQRLASFEDSIANGTDLAAIDLEARNIGIDSERWAASGGGDPAVLSAQELEALKRGTYRHLEGLVDSISNPETVLDNIRSAIREDNILKAGPEGLYAYSLLQRLPLSERQRILGSIGSDIAFFNAPTAEEEAARRAAAAAGERAGDQAAALLDQLSSGTPVSAEAAGMPRQQLEANAQFMDEATYQQAASQVEEFEFISGVAKTLNRIADPAKVREYANNIRSGGLEGDGAAGIDTDRERALLDFLDTYESNMRSAIENGEILDWARSTGSVAVGSVDMSIGAVAQGQTGLAQRRDEVAIVASRYNIPQSSVPVFTNLEAAGVVESIKQLDIEGALATFNTMQGELGDLTTNAIETLRKAGLPPEYVEMMYQTNPVLQREILQVAGMDAADIKQGLESTVATDVKTELSASLTDYRMAYEAGGGEAAQKIFNEQYAIAEKLVLNRVRSRGASVAQAVESVIEDMFPPDENWINEANARLIAPRGVDPAELTSGLQYLSSGGYLNDNGLIPLDNPLFEEEYRDLAASLASLESTGIWLNNSTGDGVILHYAIDGEIISPAQRKNAAGEIVPVELKFENAPEAASRRLQQITEDRNVDPSFGAYMEGQAIREEALKQAEGNQ